MENQLPELTVKQMWNDTLRVFNFEKGLPFTFISLLRYPHETIITYLRKNRRKFFNPLNYILIAVAFYTAIISIHPGFNKFMQNINERNAKNYATIEKQLNITIYEHFSLAQELMLSYQNIFYLIILPIIGLLTFLLFGKKFNYAEHLAINAFVFGTSTWVGVILSLATVFFDQFVIVFVLIPIITLTVLVYLYKKIYESSWLKSVLTTIAIYFAIIFCSFIFQIFMTLYFMFT